MHPAEYSILHFSHVFAAVVLVGFTYQVFAAPLPEHRKRMMIWIGVASVVMLLTGIRMWQSIYGFTVLGWIIAKIFCWLGLSVLSVLAFRLRVKSGFLEKIALLLVALAVGLVYFKWF
ncbi:MAG: hypothetical protein PHQ04_08550 [Opitutaceae bacterium]|nr:hypothetical protein [Opitutaceae bacterium]